MDVGVVDDAVADADGVVEAGEHLAAAGGLDPEAEAADLHRLFVQVDAVEVVLEDVAVEVEQGPLAAQFFEPVVRVLVRLIELLEGFDEKRAAAAGGVEDADVRKLALPEVPERDEGVALGFFEGVEVVDARVVEGAAGGPRGLRGVRGSKGLEAVVEDVRRGPGRRCSG